MATHDWMTRISDEKFLSEITMPGSHDAGVYEDDAVATGLGRKAGAVCQSDGLGGQCAKGSRFFDIRVLTHDGQMVAHHSQKVLGKRHGAYGGELGKMLGEVSTFLSANSSECVILRFSKCKDHENVVKEVKSLGAQLFKGGGNIAFQKLKNLRGKVVAVFADDFRKWYDAPEGINPFQKYEDVGGKPAFGLTTCGSYANSLNMVKVYHDQIAKVHAHDNHDRWDHLHVMYWTQTSGVKNIKSFTTAGTTTALQADQIPDRAGGGGTHAFAPHMATFIKEKMVRKGKGVARPSLPNVVLYDFVNANTSETIIALNTPPLVLA